ncbi:MAG TPA: substrate-binding domain-containing protein, partial [Acidimicrobiales bacterium]|nr:substrate-binding domain-containing protein [Acidimicrobiales bacterium]
DQGGERLLAEHAGELPDAVVCANDQMAIGVLQAFARAGVRVPGEVSVVGFDDIYPGSLYDPALTTVHQPMREIGAHACDRLLRRLAVQLDHERGEWAIEPQLEVLPTELVLRTSCGCPPGTLERRPVAAQRRARRRSPAAAPRPPRRTAGGEVSG